MEKLIYTLWRKPEADIASWSSALRGPVADALRAGGALSAQFSLVDAGVAAGEGLRLKSRDVPDGFAMFWMQSANSRATCEAALRSANAGIAGYLVTESKIKDAPPAAAGPDGRSWGFSLIGMLQRPPRLTREDWLRIWLGSHTAVAVETQPTFRYVQNVVTRLLTDEAPALDAIVEEGFPATALTDPAAFYDAVGDEEKYRANHARMMESCHRFIDFDRIDSLPTSEYMVRPLAVAL